MVQYKLLGTRLLLASSLCLNFNASAVAEVSAPLTLKEAMVSAIQTHPSVSVKRKEHVASMHSLDAAEWQRFPSLSVATNNSPVSTSPVTILTIDQPIWAGGRITANIESSKAKVIASEASIFEAEQSILTKTSSAFSEVMRLQSRVMASNENVEEHQRLLELIERRAKNQISPEAEVIMAIARLQQAKSELVQLQTQLVNANADLEQLVSMPIGQLRVPLFSLDVEGNFEATLNKAITYSPRLNRLMYEVISSDYDAEAKRAAIMPQFSVRHQEFFGGNFPGATTYLALTFQPGNGLSSLSNVKEAESKRDAAESTVDVAKKELADDIRTSWFKLDSSRSEINIYRKLVEATKTQYESSVRLYAAGRKGWLEVLNSRKEATQAKYQLADSEWSGFLAMLKLKINTGTINEFINITNMDRQDAIKY